MDMQVYLKPARQALGASLSELSELYSKQLHGVDGVVCVATEA